MKPFLVIVSLLLVHHQLFAQKKAVIPGKGETIDYLNKKAKEIIGYSKLGVNQKIFIVKKEITDGYIKPTAIGIEMFVSYKSGDYTYTTYASFNPKHIKSVLNTSASNVAAESPVGTLEIDFIGKTALYNNNGSVSTVDRATIHFLQADPDNEAQIKKALLHLKSIYKEEDTLF